MARNTNGGDSKPPKTPARRRADKRRPNAPTAANDNGGGLTPDAMSLKDADLRPSPAEVQRKAFEIYVKRGGGHGRDLDDWFEAERQLRRQ
jgi:hypothetical protein